jgi:hypothetical protein
LFLDRLFAKSGYFMSSRTPFYGLLSTIPLLLGYEFMTLFTGNYNSYSVRNMAEVVFKELLNQFDIKGTFAIAILIVGIAALVFYLQDRKTLEFHLHYIFIIILESGIYAVICGYLASEVTSLLFLNMAPAVDRNLEIMLSLGAGFYEELIFRVLLFSGTAYTLILLKLTPVKAWLLAAFFSSLLFSWCHYMNGEPFTFSGAFFRFFMAILLCILYKIRGFGVVAYTHAIYDLLVIFYQ